MGESTVKYVIQDAGDKNIDHSDLVGASPFVMLHLSPVAPFTNMV